MYPAALLNKKHILRPRSANWGEMGQLNFAYDALEGRIEGLEQAIESLRQ